MVWCLVKVKNLGTGTTLPLPYFIKMMCQYLKPFQQLMQCCKVTK